MTSETASDRGVLQPDLRTSAPQDILWRAPFAREADDSLAGTPHSVDSPALLSPGASRRPSTDGQRARSLDAASDCGTHSPPFEMDLDAGLGTRREHSEPARPIPTPQPMLATARASSCHPAVKYSQRQADGSRWSEHRPGVGRPPGVKPTNYLARTDAAAPANRGPR